MRAHVCLWRQCNKDPSAALGMTVLGERIGSQGWCAACLEDGILVSQPSPCGKACMEAASPPFFIGTMPESAFLVTSHSYDTREGIVSHVWCQILRLSPHLFWLGLFTHRAFSSAQDDDMGERKGFHLGDTLHVLELTVLYYDTSRPLEKGRAKGAGWIHEVV